MLKMEKVKFYLLLKKFFKNIYIYIHFFHKKKKKKVQSCT